MTTNPLVAFLFFLLTILLVIPLIMLAVCGVIVFAIVLPLVRAITDLFRSRSGPARPVTTEGPASGPVIDVEVTDRK